MTDTYTVKDATNDIEFLLSLTKLFTSDEKGFWFDTGLDKRHLLKMDANDEGKEIVIFQDPLPKGDYYFFNPFAEGFGKKSPAVQLFYKTIRVAFNLNLTTSLQYMMSELLKHKQALVDDPDHKLNHIVGRMSSVPVDKKTTLFDVVDEKLLDEFESIILRTKDESIFVPYMHQQMLAKVVCDVLNDPTWDEKFGKDIRKKSLLAFKSALMGVLGIKDPSELEVFSSKYDPDLKTTARLHTTLTVYLKMYSRFNDILAHAFGVNGNVAVEHEVDLGTLQQVLDRSPMAYAIAKHMVQPVMPKSSPTSTNSVDTSKLQIGGGANRLNIGGSRFPGPEVIDEFGRRGTMRNQLAIAPQTGFSRFTPHVINDQPADPFAPATRPAGGDLFGRSNSIGFGNNGGGSNYFQSQPFGNAGQFGLNLTPPNNFNSPTSRFR